jgi:4-amino-4-deoxy-L-arabinose transferase-like glycosyltransferase
LDFYDAWHTGGVVGAVKAFLVSLGFKAPLIIALPAPFYWIFGRDWHAAFLVNAIAMAITFGAVYQIGKLLRDANTGLIAVYIVGTLPLLYGLSRWYMVEHPLTALVAMTFWLVLLNSETKSEGGALALGVVSALGMLMKADFPLFVLPSLIYLFVRRSDRLHLLLWIGLPCIALAGPWYLAHWRDTWNHAFSSGFGSLAVIYRSGSLWTYFRKIADQGVSSYYILLGLIALIATIIQRKFEVFRQIAPLALWVLPFIVFTLSDNQDVRLIAPIFPAFALMVASLLNATVGNGQWIAIAALIFPFVSLLAVSFGWPYPATGSGYATRYDPTTWPQDEILSAIASDLSYFPRDKKLVLLATDRSRFNVENFALAATQHQLPLRIETTAYAANPNEVMEQSKGAAYIVYKEGGEPESPSFNKFVQEFLAHVRESPHWETLPTTYTVPDGGIAHIYRRR